MNFKKYLRYIFALAVVIAAIYFFYLQFRRNADALSTFRFNVNLYYIFTSIIFGSFALLSGPIVWRIYVNNYLHEKLSFSESFGLYCTSAMFKYIPGKVWAYAAQIALMSSKEISNTVLIYINLASFICLAFVSAIYILYYYLFCLQVVAWGISVLIFILLMVLDFAFIIWNDSIINYLIIPVNRLFKIEIQPIKTKRIIFVYAQMIYFAAYILLGIAMYFLANGLNMEIPFANMFAVMATISVSLILGLLAFFSMGGLGVREGAMFFMLKQFSNIEIALIIPIAARLLLSIIELLMGITGIIIGMKYGYFPKSVKNRQKEIVVEKAKSNILV
jgi:glycosyltransferase 2 family protein